MSLHSPNQPPAIIVKNVVYRYPRANLKALDGLSMTVPNGSIYGLTGSSGCGKTTLISCILGGMKLTSGKIYLNGHCALDSLRETVRNQVGYMPQEIALYSCFTAYELLSFFGQLAGLSQEILKSKVNEQLKFIELFHKRKCLVNTLSGGECRRISLAAALISSKKILVLDEPTVGVDSLIQMSIWKHLRSLVTTQQYTVLMTTHYYEELKMADKIGYMCDGRLHVESPPGSLLRVTNCCSISDAMLTVQKTSQLRLLLQNESHFDELLVNDYLNETCRFENIPKKSKTVSSSVGMMKALIKKNFKRQLRNIPLLLFVLVLPVLHLASMLPAANETKGMKLGVVKRELNNSLASSILGCPKEYLDDSICDVEQLSCTFLNLMDGDKVILTYYKSEDGALDATKNGQAYGHIYFSDTFSSSLTERMLTDQANLTTFLDSQIQTRLDQSNAIVVSFLLQELHRTQEAFLTMMTSTCLGSAQVGKYPLQYKDPVYGNTEAFNYVDYCLIGYFSVSLFFYSVISSGMRFLEEQNCGMLKRLLVSGTHFSEILITHYGSELVLLSVQACLTLNFLHGIVPMERDSMYLIILLFLFFIMVGWVAISLGLLIALLVNEQIYVALAGISILFPTLFISGVIWLMEGMPLALQYFARILPNTLSIESIRWIYSRGEGITHRFVWPGFVFLCGYLTLINFAIVIIWKLKCK